MKYDVIVVGAGAAGFGCTLTLGSANDKFEWAKDRKYLMLDDNKSDLNVGKYFNVAGVESGINGVDLLEKMKTQIKNYPSVELKNSKVIKIEKKDENFKVITENETYEAQIVVLATGLHKFEIECEGVKILNNIFVPKPNNIYLEHKNNIIAPNLYVAGLASGVPTMFSCASGDGVKVACDIFTKYAGKIAVVHDIKS
ncbi:NAD(P)/FAD-dependent oxidoreductase [Arcobacter porcinus]|uniref:NAD(P)/FAD-dependent oxidoreductase n=1 Tax=Arcobacter porcinus TaxID=1935204 RepID=A0A5C2HI58_9BACT|nr:NAD(P)/FAD-dependent oxidoreductase [Arcobacter porcinus]OCL86484.1 anaerobic glycerol-3-phosphate dehydrogenase subunit B [Arcobacter porcinus]OCL96932.1 anaerobic glycerol-3-phosphate dehydrogenase subunit B [Aliarcobacter thereius]QEP40762.1 NAD(P)/FAD-dependent oxidoreductase [Arcobacter porcinus]